MKTQFTTNQYNVSEENLSNHFNGLTEKVDELNLWDISILPCGHGHYSIEATFNVDGKELIVKTRTSNMQLIDAWKSGMDDMYDGFDNWDEVVESMLCAIESAELFDFFEKTC